MKPTFVIGDCHGHYDRLLALLVQEGIVDPDTEERINHDVEVVQLGDLGHFGATGTPTGDKFCYEKADNWFDVVLWGNHDRAVIDGHHAFRGYQDPGHEVRHLIGLLEHTGKLRFAHAAHGFLLTHAGLANYWWDTLSNEDPEKLAQEINERAEGRTALVDAISARRGGDAPSGGILWRHHPDEGLACVRQVFGHTAKDEIRTYWTGAGKSYCIDVGSADNGRLAGIWLPTEVVAEVQV